MLFNGISGASFIGSGLNDIYSGATQGNFWGGLARGIP